MDQSYFECRHCSERVTYSHEAMGWWTDDNVYRCEFPPTRDRAEIPTHAPQEVDVIAELRQMIAELSG